MSAPPGKRRSPGGETRAPSTTLGGVESSVSQHEGSAWLRGQVARCVARVEAVGLDPAGDTLVIAPLGRSAAPGTREDRTCDRCRAYTPQGAPFYPFGVRPLPGLLLVGGLCAGCREKEVAW